MSDGCPRTNQREVQCRVVIVASADLCDLGAFELNEDNAGAFLLVPAASHNIEPEHHADAGVDAPHPLA